MATELIYWLVLIHYCCCSYHYYLKFSSKSHFFSHQCCWFHLLSRLSRVIGSYQLTNSITIDLHCCSWSSSSSYQHLLLLFWIWPRPPAYSSFVTDFLWLIFYQCAAQMGHVTPSFPMIRQLCSSALACVRRAWTVDCERTMKSHWSGAMTYLSSRASTTTLAVITD